MSATELDVFDGIVYTTNSLRVQQGLQDDGDQ